MVITTEVPHNRLSIFGLELEDIIKFLEDLGYPKYRASQVWQGLYKNLWQTPQEFTTLPAQLKLELAQKFAFETLKPVRSLKSGDGSTEKVLFRAMDGVTFETVLMLYRVRNTVCISTQSGCAMGCKFCATGQIGFIRNLTSGEIVEQVIYAARKLQKAGKKLTNVVLMGMGEPLHNYDNVIQAIERLNHSQGFDFGIRRFTLSTVGIIPGIERIAAERRKFNLAISLHAADNELRNSLIPINKKYPIEDLIEACDKYIASTHRRVTYEWALIDQLNDTEEQAHQLGKLLKGKLCHVNLIPLNPTQKFAGVGSTIQKGKEFRDILLSYGIPCSIRARRGIDIQAGCGQLAQAEKVPGD